MKTPQQQLGAVIKAVTPILRAEFSMKKVRKTFYRFIGDIVQSVQFIPSSWSRTGQVSFTGHYQVGHIFESRLYQNTDGPIDVTRIHPFESGQIARWRIQGEEEIEPLAEHILADIRRIVIPVFAAFGSDIEYERALQIHPTDGDGSKLRDIKMALYSGDFGTARREIDRVLDKEDFVKEDVWLRGQVRFLYPYLERKSPNQPPQPTSLTGRG